MKKQFAAISAVGMALAGSLGAQSLFDLAPDETEEDSLPLTWTAGINIGYDDNPTPLLNNDDESLYGQAYVGLAFLSQSPQTTLNVGAQIGVVHYFDNLDVPGTSVDDTSFTASTYINWTHRVSERLRFVSRNHLAYELEPDYSTGFQSQRQVGNYFRWQSDNAVGYRWSDRFATYTGFKLSGITYDDFSGGDRFTWMLYNDFRYQLSERTVGTLTYRYADTEGDSGVSDSTNQYILLGLEHRFSPTTTGVLRAGVQLRDVDNGEDGSNPYVEGSLRTQMNDQFSLRGYVRYGVEDYDRAIGGLLFSDTETLRLGVSATYQVSRTFSIIGGVNYVNQGYDDLLSTNIFVGPGSVDEDLINAYIGFNLQVTDNLAVNGRYNYEDRSSDFNFREYDRNRFSLGVSTQF